MGDHREALGHYHRDLALAERLAAADPNDAEAQRDLSISSEKVGSALEKTGDLPGALARYDSSLAITQRLAAADPDNVQAQADLAGGHQRIGNVLSKTGNPREAATHFQRALAIRKSLAGRRSASWQDLHEYPSLLVTIPLQHPHDPVNAVKYAQRAITLTGGSVPAVQHTLARAYFGRGDIPRAVQAAEQALTLLRDGAAGTHARVQLRQEIEASLAEFRAARRAE